MGGAHEPEAPGSAAYAAGLGGQEWAFFIPKVDSMPARRPAAVDSIRVIGLSAIA